MSEELLDCLGRRRSPAATSAFHAGRPPGNRGLRYPADPPPVEEIIAVMRAAGDDAYGDRLRGMIVVLWRAGLRIGEALALAETDLDPGRGAILIRGAKGGKRREVGMDRFGWQHLDSWLERRRALPVGALFCILHGPTRGRSWGGARGPERAAPRGSGGSGSSAAGAISFGIRMLWSWRTRACRW
jgi:integrase